VSKTVGGAKKIKKIKKNIKKNIKKKQINFFDSLVEKKNKKKDILSAAQPQRQHHEQSLAPFPLRHRPA
jgi:hypothetical protein